MDLLIPGSLKKVLGFLGVGRQMSNDHTPPEPCKKRKLQIYEFLNDFVFYFPMQKLVWDLGFHTPQFQTNI